MANEIRTAAIPMTTHVKAVLEPAYVLHHRPYRDSSLILDMLTAAHGRVALVARGARRPRSRLHGALQPFQPLLASWIMRGELGTLTAVETRDGGLRGRALISGFYVNELLLRLLHRHDPHPQLFDAYEDVLHGLAAVSQPATEPAVAPAAGEQAVLRLFETVLLRETGYGLVLDHEVAGGDPIQADAVYYYYPERGPFREDAAAVRPRVEEAALACGGRAGPVRLHGASLLALARGELREALHLREAKCLMRAVLDTRLGGRPLASRELFRRPGGAGVGRVAEDVVNVMVESGDGT